MPLACESGRSAFGCLRRLRGLLPGVLDSVDLVLQPEAHEGIRHLEPSIEVGRGRRSDRGASRDVDQFLDVSEHGLRLSGLHAEGV